jgi:hypothetical protein
LAKLFRKHKKFFYSKNASVCSEEFFFSEEGFGREYRDYVLKTGRFLPRLTRARLPQDAALGVNL